jgi:phospholipid/cholesterol/gamma-HCH transport system permease protein
MIASIGRKALSIYSTSAELAALILGAFASVLALFSRGRRPILQVFFRQIYFTGNEALQVIFVISLAVGVAIISQISNVTDAGRGSLIGKVFVWVVIRELGPLITALVVIARSGSAIAIELGQMKFKGEIQYLETMGIPGEHYLLMPRILGVGAALFILNIYFDLVAVSGGFIVASLGWQIPPGTIKQGMFSVLTLHELFISCIKSAIFGLVIAAVGCRAGLNVGDSITQIPQAGTKAVMLSLMLVFITNVLISLSFLLW